jgi:hypothetical protein
MRPADFARFLVFFKAEGRNVNALSAQGKSFLSLVQEHPTSVDFVTTLK